jgi:1-acyl-sn-glycerol-3-phosphate acyltransferase
VKPPGLLVRRAVLDPLWVPVAAAIACLFVLAACASVVIAPLARRRRVARLALFGALYLIVDAGLLVCCTGLWLGRPVRSWRGEGWVDTHAVLLRRALTVLIAAARPLLGFAVKVEELPAPESLTGRPVLVLARHGGPGDSFAIVSLLLSRLRRRPVIVLKDTLRWDPGLDLVLSRMHSCFLPGRRAGRDLPGRIAAAARALGNRDALLLFPEGGNWTPRRHRNAMARLWARGRRTAAARAAANPHVLPPQPAGVLACLEARPDFEVVVVAHTGLEDLVSAGDIWRAVPVTERPMVMRWWQLPAVDLPVDPELRQDWLDVQWAVVDSWIDARKTARQREADEVAARPERTDVPAATPAVEAAATPAVDAAATPAADAAAAADAASQG